MPVIVFTPGQILRIVFCVGAFLAVAHDTWGWWL